MSKFNQPETEKTYNTKPPVPEEFLVRVYKRWRMKHSSEHIPKNYLEAAQWWVEHQEPQKSHERPMVGYDSKGNQHWTTPYISRIVATLRVFLGLSEPEKAFVIQHIEAGVPWRGDSIPFYKEVIKNTDVMRGYIEKHGRTEGGLLPAEYTSMITKEVKKLAKAWTDKLPYDKTNSVAAEEQGHG